MEFAAIYVAARLNVSITAVYEMDAEVFDAVYRSLVANDNTQLVRSA